jgi:galactokinase
MAVMDEPGMAEVERRATEAGRMAFGAAWRPERRAVAPGRIELLGNHLDYNGGPVLAAAIDRVVLVLVGEGEDAAGVRVVAADMPDEGTAALDPDGLAGWRNPSPPPRPFDYARGIVAATLARPELTLRQPSLVAFAGDVPIGFGLSSSAALCVGLGLALTREEPGFKALVLLAQDAEHRAGTPAGTMDQSASVAGGVIEYDGARLEVRQLAPQLGDLVFAVADSGVDRSLGSSAYPTRVEESRAALAHARRALGVEIPYLAALTAEQLATLTTGADPLSEPLLARARHVVSETERVRAGETALRAGDWTRFGALMTASGRSSATDYAISHPRVEELVAEALAVEGVLGARMMGGGEGGTALTLLRRDRVPALEAALRGGYYRKYGMAERDDLIHVCEFAPGARVEAVG